MDEGVPKGELGDFFQVQFWCATWLVSLSVGVPEQGSEQERGAVGLRLGQEDGGR